MTKTRHLVFAHVTNAVAVLVYARNSIHADIAPTITVFVCAKLIEASIAVNALMSSVFD